MWANLKLLFIFFPLSAPDAAKTTLNFDWDKFSIIYSFCIPQPLLILGPEVGLTVHLDFDGCLCAHSRKIPGSLVGAIVPRAIYPHAEACGYHSDGRRRLLRGAGGFGAHHSWGLSLRWPCAS